MINNHIMANQNDDSCLKLLHNHESKTRRRFYLERMSSSKQYFGNQFSDIKTTPEIPSRQTVATNSLPSNRIG